MPLLFIIFMPLLGIGVALFRRSPQAFLDGPTEDAPLRLLRWTAGLLSVQRGEWGLAMLSELDHIEGRGRRWRFAIGCAGAALVLPPWGRAAAGVLAMVAVAIGGLGLYTSVIIRYGLGTGYWVGVGVAIVLAILVSFVLAGIALLRRPGVALPGLLGGLFVALLWVAMSGFTFYGVIAPKTWRPGALPLVMIVVPAVVGVAGTLWGTSPIAGRRIARLAAISAGLGLFLYGTLAVAVLGAGGPPEDTSFSVHFIVTDRLVNNIISNLFIVPLVTATIGWAAAAATARVRPRLATNIDSVAFTAAGPGELITMPEAVRSALPMRSRRRALRVALLCAAATAAVLLAAAGWLRG